MISELLLKFGTAPGIAANAIPIAPVTVFVGPNNSGKSKVLAEIERFSSDGPAANDVILESLRFQSCSADDAKTAIADLTAPPPPGETQQPGHIFLESVRGGRSHLPYDGLLNSIQNPSAEGDVWGFMSKVKAWLVDPNRRGIPS